MRFGYWSAVALVAMSVACGGGGGGGGDDEVCDGGQVVDCGAVPTADVGGEDFVDGLANATCASDGKSWDTTQCTPKGSPEFTFCEATSECRRGLSCVETGTFQSYCLTVCTGGVACGADTACVDWNPSVPETEMYCLPVAATGNECFSDNTCASGADNCIPTALDEGDYLYGACTRSCASTQVGSQGSCASGEKCVGNNIDIECQGDPACGAAAVTCDITVANTCNAGQGYRCIRLGSSSKCAREPGVCVGAVLPMWAGATDLQTNISDADLCTLPAEPDGEANNYLGEIFFANTACGLTGVTGNFAAEVECIRIPGGSGQVGFCVGFCGEENGTELQCGTGYTCARPAFAEALFVDFQQSGGARVACTGTSDTTTCAVGYTCDTNNSASPQFTCQIGSKVCTPN
ncbi:MAG: hypothetical protein ACAI38_03590 [Myxococcota bacterium]